VKCQPERRQIIGGKNLSAAPLYQSGALASNSTIQNGGFGYSLFLSVRCLDMRFCYAF
jgi:hypothetical protein